MKMGVCRVVYSAEHLCVCACTECMSFGYMQCFKLHRCWLRRSSYTVAAVSCRVGRVVSSICLSRPDARRMAGLRMLLGKARDEPLNDLIY